MKAMVLEEARQQLKLQELKVPQDGEEFLALAAKLPIKTETETFPLQDANLALDRLRQGQLRGAAVLQMNENIS